MQSMLVIYKGFMESEVDGTTQGRALFLGN